MQIVEWPGTGNEPARESPTVETVAAYAREMADEDTVVFGQSMQATLLLGANPSCRGVIAVAPPSQLPPDRSDTYWDAMAEPERKARAAAITAELEHADDAAKSMLWAQFLHVRYFYDLGHPVPSPEELIAGQDWSRQVMASAARVDWRTAFDAVRAPVLLALGEYDFICPPPPWLAETPRPGWTVELFARSGHSPFLEQPDEFVDAVERWLATI